MMSISYGPYRMVDINLSEKINYITFSKKLLHNFLNPSSILPRGHLFTGIECIQNRFEVSFEILPYRLACLLQQENNWNFLLVRCKPFRNILMGSRKISIAYSAL